MLQRAVGPVLFALVVVGCTVSLPVGGEIPNGHQNQLSTDLDTPVAAGSPFKVKLWAPTVNRRCYGLLGCSDHAPMMSATLSCSDPNKCEQTDKEPNETDANECTFIMLAGEPGVSEVHAEVTTADGAVLQDTFTINVVKADDVSLHCDSCADGRTVTPGTETAISCHPLFGNSLIRGDCEARTDGAGAIALPGGADADFNITTTHGAAANNFVVKLDGAQAGNVVFRSGPVERSVGANQEITMH